MPHFICPICKINFFNPHKQTKVCSMPCYGKYRSIYYSKEKHPQWKNKLTYSGYHTWLKREFGFPKKCDNKRCKTINPLCYEWSLKKGFQYKRNRENYWRLCINCHRKYDYNLKQAELHSKRMRGRIPWNKGKFGYRAGPTLNKKHYSSSYIRKYPFLRDYVPR